MVMLWDYDWFVLYGHNPIANCLVTFYGPANSFAQYEIHPSSSDGTIARKVYNIILNVEKATSSPMIFSDVKPIHFNFNDILLS